MPNTVHTAGSKPTHCHSMNGQTIPALRVYWRSASTSIQPTIAGPLRTPVGMETLPSVVSNNVRIYSVGGSEHEQGLAPWQTTAGQRKRLRKEDPSWARRVTLLQDYGFPEAASRISVSADGRSLLATGTYKPRLRIYDLDQASLRCERHLSAETVGLTVLGDDWTRLALLQADRSVELHAAGGRHAVLRLPRQGRAQCYDARRAELLVGVSGSGALHRVSLCRGSFLAPVESRVSGSINALSLSPGHGLLAAACDGGAVSFFDPRVRTCVGSVALDADASYDASSVSWAPDGLTWAAGTSGGAVHVYDVRSHSRPQWSRDLGDGTAVVRLSHGHIADAGAAIYAADSRAIRVLEGSGSLITTIETAAPIADYCTVPGSGMVLAALDAPQMGAYFVPRLGPAPSWCSFLERLTEEMDESSASAGAAGTTVANYRFATGDDLRAVGLDHLRGTRALRPYMHGFFLDSRLYERARAIARPTAHAEHVAATRAARLEALRGSRVAVSKPGAGVNSDLAAKLAEMAQADAEVDATPNKRQSKGERKAQRDRGVARAVLSDDRFSALFTDAEYARDSNE